MRYRLALWALGLVVRRRRSLSSTGANTPGAGAGGVARLSSIRSRSSSGRHGTWRSTSWPWASSRSRCFPSRSGACSAPRSSVSGRPGSRWRRARLRSSFPSPRVDERVRARHPPRAVPVLLTPLVLTAVAAGSKRGLRPSRRTAWIAALAAVAVAASLPADQVARANNVDSPTAAWIRDLHAVSPWSPSRRGCWSSGWPRSGLSCSSASRSRAAPLVAAAVAFGALVCWLDYSDPISPEQDRQLAWVDRCPPSRHSSLAPPPRLLAARPTVRGRDRCRAAGPRRLDGVLQREHRPCLPLRRGGRARQPRLAAVARRAGRRRLLGRAAVRPEVCRARLAPARGRKALARFDLSTLGTVYQEGASLTLWAVDPPLRFLPHAQPLAPRADGRPC